MSKRAVLGRTLTVAGVAAALTLGAVGSAGAQPAPDSAVDPQYTVTISDLFINADGDGFCDPVGSADPTVFWVDPDGVTHRKFAFDLDHVSDFRGTWTEVDVNRGLTKPTLEWADRDIDGIGSVGENVLPRGPQLLPFPGSYPDRNPVVQEVVETLPDAGGDGCSASMYYTITYTLTAPAP